MLQGANRGAAVARAAAAVRRRAALVSVTVLVLWAGCSRKPVASDGGANDAGDGSGSAGRGGGSPGSGGAGGMGGTAARGGAGGGGGASAGAGGAGGSAIGGGAGAAVGGRGGASGAAGGAGAAGSGGGAAGAPGGRGGAGAGGTAPGGAGGGGVAGAGGAAGTAPGGAGGGGSSGSAGGAGGSAGGAGGSAGGARGGAGGGGSGGGVAPGVVSCPASPPSGACSVQDLTCSYAARTCFCDHGTWTCRPCPANQPRQGDTCYPLEDRALMSCTYGNVTCSCNDSSVGSGWACGVCPASRPTNGGRCAANTPFECRYGADNCVCDGSNWTCSEAACIEPGPDGDPSSCAWPAVHTCLYPRLDQACSCGGIDDTRCTCPAEAPLEDSRCLGPVGPDPGGCAYGDRLCDCQNGRWRCGVCPINLPANASACSVPASCSYATGFCYCNGTTWSCS